MPITLNGTTGIIGPDGSAATPAIQGSDTNTGIFFPAADTIAFAEGGTEVMRIDSAGNLGVGIVPSVWTSYTAAQVGAVGSLGSANFGGGNQQTVLLNNAYHNSGFKYLTSSVAAMYRQLGGEHQWHYAASGTAGSAITFTQAMTLDASGNLLVGTTSNSGKLSVDGGTGMSSSGVIARFLGTSGNSLIVRGSGNCENTNGAYGAISDAKLKENVTDATPKLEKLNQVRIVNFNLIGSEQKQIGVIAQELEQIFPGMVEETADTDSEGNDLGTTTKSVKYSVFVPMLIKAIQEQQALITSLTARIAALEGAAQ